MTGAEQSDIRQGDIYWVDFIEPTGSGAGYQHPHVVIQNNVFNQSRISTVVVCAITSNLTWAKSPGNVLLNKGGANLPKESVVNITQIKTIDKSYLGEKIGTLAKAKTRQIVDGVKLLIEQRELLLFKSTRR